MRLREALVLLAAYVVGGWCLGLVFFHVFDEIPDPLPPEPDWAELEREGQYGGVDRIGQPIVSDRLGDWAIGHGEEMPDPFPPPPEPQLEEIVWDDATGKLSGPQFDLDDYEGWTVSELTFTVAEGEDVSMIVFPADCAVGDVLLFERLQEQIDLLCESTE